MRPKPSIWKRLRWWQMRRRRKLAVWLVELLYGEDMLWDDDDPEVCVNEISEWASDSWGATKDGETMDHKFMRALALPTKTYRITVKTYEDSDDIDYLYQPL